MYSSQVGTRVVTALVVVGSIGAAVFGARRVFLLWWPGSRGPDIIESISPRSSYSPQLAAQAGQARAAIVRVSTEPGRVAIGSVCMSYGVNKYALFVALQHRTPRPSSRSSKLLVPHYY